MREGRKAQGLKDSSGHRLPHPAILPLMLGPRIRIIPILKENKDKRKQKEKGKDKCSRFLLRSSFCLPIPAPAHWNSRIRGRPLRDPDVRPPCSNSTLSSPQRAAPPLSRGAARPPGPSSAAGLIRWTRMEARPEWDLRKMRELRFVVLLLVISLPCFSASDRQGTTALPYHSSKVTLSSAIACLCVRMSVFCVPVSWANGNLVVYC